MKAGLLNMWVFVSKGGLRKSLKCESYLTCGSSEIVRSIAMQSRLSDDRLFIIVKRKYIFLLFILVVNQINKLIDVI